MRYTIWCMDCKTDKKWRKVNAFTENYYRFTSKKKAQEEADRLNRDYAGTFYTHWVERI